MSYRGMKAVLGMVVLTGSWLATSSGSVQAQPPAPVALRASTTTANDETPEVQRQHVKANIEMWEARVYKRLSAVNQIGETMDFAELKTQKLAITEVQALLKELDLAAEEILSTYSQAGPDLRRYREALEQAPAVFNRLAQEYETKANDNRFQTFKEGYADCASEARRYAVYYASRVREVDGWENDISHKLDYVKESRTFIHDAQTLLAAIPIDAGLETEKLVKRINTYMKAFDDALKAMRGVTSRIGEGQAKPQSTGSKSGATSSDTSSVLGTYRQRLANLKK